MRTCSTSSGSPRGGCRGAPVGDSHPTQAGVGDAYARHVSQGMATLAQLMNAHVEVRAQASHIWDEEGTQYLDCGGYGVFLLGHRHPHVVESVKRQLDRQGFASRVLL